MWWSLCNYRVWCGGMCGVVWCGEDGEVCVVKRCFGLDGKSLVVRLWIFIKIDFNVCQI